jgi:hypothetical protein
MAVSERFDRIQDSIVAAQKLFVVEITHSN